MLQIAVYSVTIIANRTQGFIVSNGLFHATGRKVPDFLIAIDQSIA